MLRIPRFMGFGPSCHTEGTVHDFTGTRQGLAVDATAPKTCYNGRIRSNNGRVTEPYFEAQPRTTKAKPGLTLIWITQHTATTTTTTTTTPPPPPHCTLHHTPTPQSTTLHTSPPTPQAPPSMRHRKPRTCAHGDRDRSRSAELSEPHFREGALIQAAMHNATTAHLPPPTLTPWNFKAILARFQEMATTTPDDR